eukprot:COSAG02_NODE_2188_length_9569_cov_21.824710_6_plen_172_part_00
MCTLPRGRATRGRIRRSADRDRAWDSDKESRVSGETRWYTHPPTHTHTRPECPATRPLTHRQQHNREYSQSAGRPQPRSQPYPRRCTPSPATPYFFGPKCDSRPTRGGGLLKSVPHRRLIKAREFQFWRRNIAAATRRAGRVPMDFPVVSSGGAADQAGSLLVRLVPSWVP